MRLNLELSLVVLYKNRSIAKARDSRLNRLAGKYATLAEIIIIKRKAHRDFASRASFVLCGFFYVSDLDFLGGHGRCFLLVVVVDGTRETQPLRIINKNLLEKGGIVSNQRIARRTLAA